LGQVRCNSYNTSNGVYGALWLNAGGKFPDAPKDYIQQAVPRAKNYLLFKDMVIVRLGLTDESQFDINEVLKGILEF
jgi:hypothetical protein